MRNPGPPRECAHAVRLYAASRRRPSPACSCSTTQPQLSRPCRRAELLVGPAEQRAPTATRIAAPWRDRDARLRRRQARAQQLAQRRDHPRRARRPAARRRATVVVAAARNCANSSGSRGWYSAWVRPSRSPKPNSRSRASYVGCQPRRRSDLRGRLRARGRGRRTTAARRAARRAPGRRARPGACPTSSRPTSGWPWTRRRGSRRCGRGAAGPACGRHRWAGGLSRRADRSTSAGSLMTGQSRHSRSRA